MADRQPSWLTRAVAHAGWGLAVVLATYLLTMVVSLDRTIASLPPQEFRNYVETLRVRIRKLELDVARLQTVNEQQPTKGK